MAGRGAPRLFPKPGITEQRGNQGGILHFALLRWTACQRLACQLGGWASAPVTHQAPGPVAPNSKTRPKHPTEKGRTLWLDHRHTARSLTYVLEDPLPQQVKHLGGQLIVRAPCMLSHH